MSVMDEALHIETLCSLPHHLGSSFYSNYKKQFLKFRIGNYLYIDKGGDNRRGCETSIFP